MHQQQQISSNAIAIAPDPRQLSLFRPRIQTIGELEEPLPDLLRAHLARSGLSQCLFAEWVLSRDPRTLSRWLAGEKIPPIARNWIRRLEAVDVLERSVLIKVARRRVAPRSIGQRWDFYM